MVAITDSAGGCDRFFLPNPGGFGANHVLQDNVPDPTIGHCKNDQLPVDAKTTVQARLEYRGELSLFGLEAYTLHYRGREFNVVGKNADEATQNAIKMIHGGGPLNVYGKVGPNEEVILTPPDGQKVTISGAGGAGSGHAAGQAQMEERFTFAGVTVYTVRYGGQEFTVTGKNVEEAVANAVDYIRDMGRLGFFNNVNTNESVVLNLPNGGQKEITL